MDGSAINPTIYLIGTDKEVLNRLYLFCKKGFTELNFFRSVSLPPEIGCDLGIPLPNVLFNDPFGPISKSITFNSGVNIFYIDGFAEKSASVTPSCADLFSMCASRSDELFSVYNSLVEKLLIPSSEEAVSVYQSKLNQRKQLLVAEFERECEAIKIDLPSIASHKKTWKTYCKVSGYMFFDKQNVDLNLQKQDSFHTYISYLFSRCLEFVESGKSRTDTKKISSLKLSAQLSEQQVAISDTSLMNCSVCFANSPMGYGDYIQRMQRMYDLLVGLGNDIDIYQAEYTNPHVADLDFSEYVNIDIANWGTNEETKYIIEFEEFFYLLNCGLRNRVEVGCYAIYLHKAFRNIDYIFSAFSKEFFYGHVEFSSKVPRVSTEPDTYNVVFHLRRHDTALSLIENLLPTEIVARMGVKRPLLTSSFCEQVTDTYMRLNKIVDRPIHVSIISDGFLGLSERYNKLCHFNKIKSELSVIEAFHEFENDLLTTKLTTLRGSINHICVGREKEKTINSLGLIANSDLIITSSGFALVLAKIAGKPVINGFDAMKSMSISQNSFEQLCIEAAKL